MKAKEMQLPSLYFFLLY